MNKIASVILAIILGITPAWSQTTAPLGPTNGGGGGGGGGGGSGTVTSIATGCQATGGTITTTGTISTQDQWFALSTNAIVAGDCGGTVSVGSSSDTAPTIAVSGSAGFPQWWYTYLCNAGTHSQTITPASGTIGGASTYVLAAGTAAAPACVKITSDAANTNYKVSFVPAPAAPVGANPSATAGPSANNGSATTFMRSDASPAVQVGSASQEGIVQVDGTTITASTGTISTPGGANPSGTAGPTAVNGSAATFMRSDGAPAIQKATNSIFGIVEVDNTTIGAASGVISVKAVPFATGSSTGNTVTGPFEIFVCTAACTVTPPVPVAGYQFCVMNSDNVTGAITLGALGSSARYENTARTAYGTAGTGTLTSGGAAGDMICIIGLDATHYLSPTYVGTWVAS